MPDDGRVTRDCYRDAYESWAKVQEQADELAERLDDLTHEGLDHVSAATLSRWAGDDVTEYRVRNWDVRWHRRHDEPRRHAVVKDTEPGDTEPATATATAEG